MQDKKQQLEVDVEQLTGSKLGKEYNSTIYCHPTHLTYVQSVCLHAESVTSVVSDSVQPCHFNPPGLSVHGILQAVLE